MPPMNCTQKGLRCKASITNCLDGGWLVERKYTPSGPVELTVRVNVRPDELGDLVPVIEVNWKAQDEGSIIFLKGTEVQVLKIPTNQILCVRFDFLTEEIPMRNQDNEKWSFHLDQVVVDPDVEYSVSVYNLPRPNLAYSGYNIRQSIRIPDCKNALIKRSKVCLRSGSLWEPNITLESSAGSKGHVTVGFVGGEYAQQYHLSLTCSSEMQAINVPQRNQSSLNISFPLSMWPRSCCDFDVEIQPFFTQCQNDCTRQKQSFNICRDDPKAKDDPFWPIIWIAISFSASLVLVLVWLIFSRYKKQPKGPTEVPIKVQSDLVHPRPGDPPKVLLIYSQDHPLYTDIVLKLCAFLRAQCGVEVLLDLLDSSSLSAVGRLPWLEGQRRRLDGSDKILVLCSRGVQAKWSAMCGAGPVTLREDVRSPNDDMLTPALGLLLPDLQCAAAHGRYAVAFFEGVSSERDVPSVFDAAVKYRLMKHFEELYLRIVEVEKFSPGRVAQVRGVGPDDYFACPSGRVLKEAVERFQAYQKENPDWFEKQCVDAEEVPSFEYDPLLEQPVPPVLQCLPVCRDGPPILLQQMEPLQSGSAIHTLTPHFNLGCEGLPVMEIHPESNPEDRQIYSAHPVLNTHPGLLQSGLYPAALDDPTCPPVNSLQSRWSLYGQDESGVHPVTVDTEEESHESSAQPSRETLQNLLFLQLSLCMATPSVSTEMPSVCLENCYTLSSPLETHPSVPIEMEEGETGAETTGRRPASASDQGYISQSSLLNAVGGYLLEEERPEEDPHLLLGRLQELLHSSISSGFGTQMAGEEDELLPAS